MFIRNSIKYNLRVRITF